MAIASTNALMILVAAGIQFDHCNFSDIVLPPQRDICGLMETASLEEKLKEVPKLFPSKEYRTSSMHSSTAKESYSKPVFNLANAK